jgi:DNA-binding CsgD family transcriptional regulator/tetratricopeptide (TPR) repeat protein
VPARLIPGKQRQGTHHRLSDSPRHGFNVVMLVERTSLLDALAAELPAANQAGHLVFLGGEAGVGKSTIVNALAERAGADVAVRRGNCDNVTTPAALGPFAEAVPELAELIDSEARINLLRAYRQLRAAVQHSPALVIVEDVHWADEATLDMLRVTARRLESLPILLLATYRADEVGAEHPLTVLLGDLATVPGVGRMHVAPLSIDGVRELAASAHSAIDPARLHRDTGGNPFYVTEVLAAGGADVPPSVRDAVLARANRLPAGARRVLDAASIIGPRTGLSLLLDVSGQQATDVDVCLQRGMLVEAGGAGRTVGFRHELARIAVEHTLAPSVRTQLHAAAFAALQQAGERDHRRLAHHAEQSGDPAGVLAYAPRAAARAARLGAHREAAALYRRALDAGDPDEATRAALCTALSYECYLTDQVAEAHATRLEALRIAEQAGDRFGVGVAQRWLSRLSWFFGRSDEAETWGSRAIETLEPLGETRELAMAYSNFAQLRMLSFDRAQALEWGERALALARRLGDAETEMHALNNIGTVMFLDGAEVGGTQRLAQSLDLALAADAQEHAARAYTNLGSTAAGSRRLTESERYFRTGIEYCTDRDLDSWRLYMAAWLARVLVERGDIADARAQARDVVRHRRLSPITHIVAAVVLAQLAMRRGESDDGVLDEARTLARDTTESQRLVPVAAAGAEAAWLAGRLEDVVAEVDRAWQTAIDHPHPWEVGELAWWLAVGGVRREVPVEIPEPFALLLAGRWTDAAAAWQALDCPLWRAHALARSASLDDARAAMDIVAGLDAPAVWEAMQRDRHSAGLQVPRRRQPSTRTNPWQLTAREAEVLQLLTAGLSNADLAQRLYLSEKTVGHHVSAILRKLGRPTRAAAVAEARKYGFVEAE